MTREKTEYIVQRWNGHEEVFVDTDISIGSGALRNTAEAMKAIRDEGKPETYRIIAVKATVTTAVKTRNVVTITPRAITTPGAKGEDRAGIK